MLWGAGDVQGEQRSELSLLWWQLSYFNFTFALQTVSESNGRIPVAMRRRWRYF